MVGVGTKPVARLTPRVVVDDGEVEAVGTDRAIAVVVVAVLIFVVVVVVAAEVGGE